MRSTSVMFVTRRAVDEARGRTSRSNALEICSRMARSGLDAGGEHERLETREPVAGVGVDRQRALMARVHAWSMSTVSAPRTSPTMMRSGRMRRELRTSSRMRISPVPSMFAGRDSR